MIARLVALLGLIALPALAEVPVAEMTTPGGLSAWLVPAPEIPFVALEIRFRGGATLDPPGKEGAVALMAGLLEEGSGDLDAQGFAAARDRLAAGFGFSSGRDSVGVSARFLTENRDVAVELLRQALVVPTFTADAVERVRGQLLANRRGADQDPATRAAEAFDRLAFDGHLYARPVDGTTESIAALTADDVRTAWRAGLARDRVHVVAVGDITAAELGPLLDRLLGDLPATGAPLADRAPVRLAGQLLVEPFPGPQAAILFGQPGIGRDDPDFYPAFVAAEILGGGRFGTRLMTELREKRGLTYGVSAGLAQYDLADLVIGQVRTANATVGEAVAVIRTEWARAADISADELAAAQTYLTGAYPLRWNGNANIARQLVGLQMQGYPVDYPARRNGLIAAVTLEQARAAAARILDPATLTFVIVGQPEGLEQQ